MLSLRPLRDPALRYLLFAAGTAVAVFGVLRLAWVERSLLLPVTAMQQRAACLLVGDPTGPITVGLSCSGADVIALCLGAILAYPVAWRRRLAGAAGGLAVILGLNVLRLGTLGRLAHRPSWFELLHVYLWPGVLVLATAAYVFLWMRAGAGNVHQPARRVFARWAQVPGRPVVRFLLLAVVLVSAYLAAAPWLMRTAWAANAGHAVAGSAAFLVGLFGGAAEASGGLFRTSHGLFRVTPECVLTPVLPIYLAAAGSLPLGRSARVLALAAAVPLFFALATARLLVLVLPLAVVRSHLPAVHGFYQLALGAVVVALAAAWTGGPGRQRAARALAGIAGCAALGWLVGPFYTRLLWAWLEPSAPDPQGALRLLPAFQLALFAGVWLASKAPLRARAAKALLLLIASQPATVWLVELAHGRWQIATHPLLLRGWALAAPVLAFALALGRGPASGESRYRRFWAQVGREFPDLGGARSTRHYRRDEQWLLRAALPDLPGLRVLKTDLWDEAKNTRILHWASDQGARCTGIDISPPIVIAATRGQRPSGGQPVRGVVADVRRLPFRAGAFDAVYSMGTVEHFDETQGAVNEIARILRPGGRAVLGVPNRHDPFLRPLLVWVMYRLGLYDYGFEKSYSRRGLRRLLERAGLRVELESGILFIPGWLRILDLWCWTRARPLAAVTGTAVALFDRLSRRWPALRRHGYLLASVGVRPQLDSGDSTALSPDA